MYIYIDRVNSLLDDALETYSFKETSKVFYRGRVNKFFRDYMSIEPNINRPLNTLTSDDLNSYFSMLQCKDSEKVNLYQALKFFFDYTYLIYETPEITSRVEKPNYIPRSTKYVDDEDYRKLREFIVNRTGNLQERLILGLFLFTGLSRQYLSKLINAQLIFDNGFYKLKVWASNSEVLLPLKLELQILVHEHLMNLATDDRLSRVIPYDENYLSTFISNKTRELTGSKYSPTNLSSTFIKKALLEGNHIWEVSRLTLESVSIIKKHLTNSDYFIKQSEILNRII